MNGLERKSRQPSETNDQRHDIGTKSKCTTMTGEGSREANLDDFLLCVQLRAFGLRNVDSAKLACIRPPLPGVSSIVGRQLEF